MQREKSLVNWYKTAEGKSFSKDLAAVLDKSLDRSFGYYALQLGYFPEYLLENSPVMHCFRAGDHTGSFNCETAQLPIDSGSVDLLILSHALELSADPHATLREAERVLVGEGKLFIVGFTPFSPVGLYQRAVDPDYQRFTSFRVRDWLGVLGIECQSTTMVGREIVQRSFKSPALNSGLKGVNYLLGKLKGRGYLIEARKRVTRLTPLKPQWAQPARLLKPVSVAKQGNTRVSREKWRPK